MVCGCLPALYPEEKGRNRPLRIDGKAKRKEKTEKISFSYYTK